MLDRTAIHQHPNPGGSASHDLTPYSPPIDQPRTSTARFLDSAGGVLHDLDNLAVQLGCDSPTWTWSTDFDYRNPDQHLPMLVGKFTDRRPASARQWAQALGLTPTHDPVPGTVAYHGRIDGLRIGLWVIVDKAAYSQPSTPTRTFLLAGLLAATGTIAAVLLTRHTKATIIAKTLSR